MPGAQRLSLHQLISNFKERNQQTTCAIFILDPQTLTKRQVHRFGAKVTYAATLAGDLNVLAFNFKIDL